jgi:hypothetical protein
MPLEPDYVNSGFTEPDDAPPVDDEGAEDLGTLLGEVLDLTDQEIAARISDEEIATRLEHVKRQVSYNQEAILCPHCKKRIRLNNDGRVRKHVSGKAKSPECEGSDAIVARGGRIITGAELQALADEAEAGYDVSKLRSKNLFSDAQ